MKIILYLVQKEFIQIFRNKTMAPILFFMPVVQLLVLTYAANFEIKNIRLHIVDRDQSQTSRRLSGKLQGSGYFILTGQSLTMEEAMRQLETDRTDVVLTIPQSFDKDLIQPGPAQIQAQINAINGTKAALANSYLNAIVMDFAKETGAENFRQIQTASPISISPGNWFNPFTDYKLFMAPGILALLVTMISLFLTSMNIVREKELGTIEQLNVTTIKKPQFIIGKLLPFWAIALVEFFFGLALIHLFFNVPVEGSFWVLFLFTNLYLFTMLGAGMFISTLAHTQQQAMFISWFFMVIFLLMSGLFTPIESMPGWAQAIARFNPVAYFVEFMRMLTLKGSEFRHVRMHFLIMAAFAVGVNALAVWNYRKTTA